LDGVVDNTDYMIWQSHFGSGTLYTDGDANLDGVVNAADYTIWRDHLGFHTPPLGQGTASGAAVPEPSGFAIQLSALLSLIAALCARRTQFVSVERFDDVVRTLELKLSLGNSS
jgi:hypothetical protein